MTTVAIAIGSNLGDRESHLRFACDRLSLLLSGLKTSAIHETDPFGVPVAQERFLNAAAVGTVDMRPDALLAALLAVEDERGRERPFPLAPRTLDLDLILFGDLVVSGARLTVPHPRFRERAFVLNPLVEIAPDLKDPVTGATIAELAQRLGQPRRARS